MRRSTVHLQAACELELPALSLVPVLLEALHDVVPSSRNLFDWTDDDGQLLHYFIEGPVDEAVARHYFDEFHNRREAEVMPAFDSLTRAPAGVRSAAELDHPAFFASALYNEIWRPQGMKYRMEAVLRGSRGQLIGSLVLYRGPGDRCFTPQDETRLHSLLPMLSGALERNTLPAEPLRHVPRPGATQTLLIGADGRVCHASAGARRLLMLARGGINRQGLEAPLEVLAGPLLQPLLRALHGQPGTPPQTVVHDNAWGRFSLVATVLAPLPAVAMPGVPAASLVQVMLHWSEPHHQALQRAFRRLPLTAGQVAVCRELYQGLSQAAIGGRLGVSPTTVVDHARKLYRTLGVRSVMELRAMIDEAVQSDPADTTALGT
jgi:DNA-binding CsgD family transcriptional regulator